MQRRGSTIIFKHIFNALPLLYKINKPQWQPLCGSLIMDHHDIVVFSLCVRGAVRGPALVSMRRLFFLWPRAITMENLLMGCMWARLELPAGSVCWHPGAHRIATGHAHTTADPLARRPPTSPPLDAHGQVFASSKRADTQETDRPADRGLQVMTMT